MKLSLLSATAIGASLLWGQTAPGDSPGNGLFRRIPAAGSPVRGNPGFRALHLSGCDDCSSAQPAELGFAIDFYGRGFSQAWVNANGSITFDAPAGGSAPAPLETLGRAMIAPLWTGGTAQKGPAVGVSYGQDAVEGHRAFGVSWTGGVQLVLIDRSDLGPGFFDIEMNYGSLEEAAGGRLGARAGFTNGTGAAGTWRELPGSGLAGRHTFSIRPSNVAVQPGSPGGGTPAPAPMTSTIGSITTYPVPTPSSQPVGITAGPDGNLWFTEYASGKVGKMTTAGLATEYSPLTSNSQPSAIVAGPDGNLWFTEYAVGKIGRVTPSGSFTEWPLSNPTCYPTGIAVGPDGALWFTEWGGLGQIGRITTGGSITEYPVLTFGSSPNYIAAGPDGNLWFTEQTASRIGKITTAGTVTEYPTLTSNSAPFGIAAGSDGALWFTEQTANKIGRITTSGIVTEYAIPTSTGEPWGVTLGPDGAIWFAEWGGNRIGRITPAESFNEYYAGASTGPNSLTVGADGAIWFTESENGNNIGRIVTGGGPATSSILSIYPDTVVAGSGDFDLDLSGTAFQSGATVYWNGAPLATSFLPPVFLSAHVPAAFLSIPGTALITVANPGEAPSSPIPLSIIPSAQPPVLTNAYVTYSWFSDDGLFAGAILGFAGNGFEPGATIAWNGGSLGTFGINFEIFNLSNSLVQTPGPVSITAANPGSAVSNAINFTIPPLRTLSSISPTATPQGSAFTLTVFGSGFTATDLVALSSTGPAFGVNFINSGEIQANIPASAVPTAGTLMVWVSTNFDGGSVTSVNELPLTVTPAPSLGITKTHIGNFTQGQQNAAYTVTVSNAAGAGTTSGMVTVTETPPAGLSVVSMSGTGWTCPGDNTCNRSDPLGANSSYNAITVLVNVSAGATSPQINHAAVSGGGSLTAGVNDSTVIFQTPANIAATAGSGQNARVNTVFTLPLQATVTDGIGNPVAGVTVTFTAPASGPGGAFSGSPTIMLVTDALGHAAATFTANTIAGSYSVTATVAGVPGAANFSLTNTAGLPASITATTGIGETATVNTAFSLALQATVQDSFGNPVPGAAVTFSAPAGPSPSGTFGGSRTTTPNTNSLGVATTPIFTANTTAGSFPVTATVSGVATGVVFALTNLAGPPASITATQGSGQTAPVNTAFAVALQATVRDSFSNPVPGATVTFTAPGSGASGAFGGSLTAAPATNSSGVATAPAFTANAATGSYNVTAAVNGVAAHANFALSNTSSTATLTITKTHSGNFTQSQNGATFTVTVSNAVGSAPTSGTVTVTESLPAGLTLAGMSGGGWSCPGNTCTRSDALNGGLSYPAITVTVNVSVSAAPSLTNTVTVSGGGSPSPATAHDTVAVVPIVGCSALTFDDTIGDTGALSQSCVLSNPNNLTLTLNVSSNPPWLSATTLFAPNLIVTEVQGPFTYHPGAYTGTVTVLGNGSPVGTVNVTLNLTAVTTLAPTSNSVGSGASTSSFNVTSTGPWAIAGNNSWVAITSPPRDTSGNLCSSGNGSVTYSVAANTAFASRTATFTLLSGCPTAGPTFAVGTFTLTQAGQSTCNFAPGTIFPQGQQTSFTYAAAGTNGNDTAVLLNNVCVNITPVSQNNWIAITGSPSNSKFTFSVAPYFGTTIRSGTIQVGPDNISVTQNPPACTYSLATTPGFSSVFPAAGGAGSMTIGVSSTPCAWTATPSSAAFITGLSPTSGNGPATLTFTIPPNAQAVAQSGTINVENVKYAITQAAASPTQPSYTCTVTADPVRTLRAEGAAELVSDLLLACSGASAGGILGDVIVTLGDNTTVTNHTLTSDPSNSTTDALLLNVDVASPTWVLGQNAYRGTVAGPRAIRFPSVSLAPEHGAFSHTFRLTNVRVDASHIASLSNGQSAAPIAAASITIQPPLAAPAAGAPFQVPTTPLTVGQAPSTAGPGATYTISPSSAFSAGSLAAGLAPGTSYWPLTFTEQQAHAYLPAASESGFVNAAFGTETGSSNNGSWTDPSAAMGTRLLATVANVPCSASLYAPVAPASSGAAQLVSADSTGAGGFPAVASAITISGVALDGYQLLPLTPSNGAATCTTTGSATVTWEVTAALAGSPAALTFNLYISNPTSASLAGVTFTGGPAPQVAVSSPGPTAPVPRFNTFQNILNGSTPVLLSFFFVPTGSASNSGQAAHTLASKLVPETSDGGQCSQTVTAIITNNGSATANSVSAVQGPGPLSGCFGPNAQNSGPNCNCSSNVPPGGQYQCSATYPSCTPGSYAGYATSDQGNDDPNSSDTVQPAAPIVTLTTLQAPAVFTQGDLSGNDTLTVRVMNTGDDAPPGSISITQTLPANSGLTVVSAAPPAGSIGDPFSQYWVCTHTPLTATCTYGNNQQYLLNSSKTPAGFTQFSLTFQTTSAATANVVDTLQLNTTVGGNQYGTDYTPTIAIQGGLQITAPSSSTLPQATVGAPYTFNGFAAAGGSGAYSWSASGLPAGLNMSSAGVISGTANAAAVATVIVTLSDAAPNSSTPRVTGAYSLTVTAPAITIQTSPTSLQFTVDGGAPQTAPKTLNLAAGPHTIAVATTQAGATGVQNVFTSWSDSGAASHTINITSSATYTATFQTQYQLNISASPSADGTVSPATGGFYNSGASVNISATADTGYSFTGWTGSVASPSSASTTIAMNAPETVVANFSAGTTIQTMPSGLQFSIDGGAAQTAPQVLNLSPGAHTLAVAATQSALPQDAAGTQYAFLSWSDGGAVSHTINVGSTPATFTATFQTQYLLNISASPSAGGTVSPATGAFYSKNSIVTITATAGSQYTFNGWSGPVANSASATTTVTMSAPETVVANFSSRTGITIQTSPPGLAFTVDGGAAQSAPQVLNLSQGTHTLAVATTQPGATGVQNVFTSWSDSGAASHTITVTPLAATYTATFQTQYRLTISAAPAAGGTFSPPSGAFYPAGTSVPVSATANSGYQFSSWTGSVANFTAASTSVAMSAPETLTANFAPITTTSGLAFYPVTPCRVADTRNANGPYGGPTLAGGSTRNFAIASSPCAIPSTAQAYSLNITAVPPAPLGYLTAWPTGQPQPLVSTLNSSNGAIIANAAIVPSTTGSVSIFVSDATHVIIDINGYFAPPGSGGLAFYPTSPCRVADTRSGTSLPAGSTRNFNVPASACNIPSTAQAYSLNMTAVPPGALGYLTTWPAGQSQPLVSTLNALQGQIAANAAIVPAGASGAISVFVSDSSNVVIDIDGYFAPPGSGALYFYPVTPCRIADTRGPTGTFGGPALGANATRTFPILSSGCGLPPTALAYSLNMTAVPPGFLLYLSTWPAGQSQPGVSTLNDPQAQIVANAAIVPSGAGSISVFVSNPTHLVIDVNGYFAR